MHDLLLISITIIFITVILPFLQTISDICVTFGQWILSKINVAITKNNIKVQTLNEQDNQQKTPVIGFKVSSNENFDVEENKQNKKVGF